MRGNSNSRALRKTKYRLKPLPLGCAISFAALGAPSLTRSSDSSRLPAELAKAAAGGLFAQTSSACASCAPLLPSQGGYPRDSRKACERNGSAAGQTVLYFAYPSRPAACG